MRHKASPKEVPGSQLYGKRVLSINSLSYLYFRDGILASKDVPFTLRVGQSECLVNPHSVVNSSPNLSYKQSLGTLHVVNASSSSSDDRSSSPASASTTKGKKLINVSESP